MRLLGFITGVSLLAFLFVVIRYPQVLSMGTQGPATDTKILQLPEPETAKTNGDQAMAQIGKVNEISIFNPDQLPVDTLNGSADPSTGLDMAIQSKPKILISQPTAPKKFGNQNKIFSVEDDSKQKEAVADLLGLENAQSKAGQSLDLSDNLISATTVQWHHFWGPFRTRLSAQGFVNNLVKKTAVDLKVIENRPGAFMVAFPYVSEAEREQTATMIEQQTGLRLSNR